ncbi:hypothetical protein BURPSPAST_D0422 [Burkholderia pseudomallei Pasteur 52237]|nr:hypothetical protein BURPSPAST_D0422 [Burkholderia pseudomallei Pasteur 52237]
MNGGGARRRDGRPRARADAAPAKGAAVRARAARIARLRKARRT